MTGPLTCIELIHKKFDVPLDNVIHTEAPFHFLRDDLDQTEEQFVAHCICKFEALIARERADTIAAIGGAPDLGTDRTVPRPEGNGRPFKRF
ncbi:MAG: L-2,4-diaminobutyrate transaminase [Ascidiaceihabitans sp.]